MDLEITVLYALFQGRKSGNNYSVQNDFCALLTSFFKRDLTSNNDDVVKRGETSPLDQ